MGARLPRAHGGVAAGGHVRGPLRGPGRSAVRRRRGARGEGVAGAGALRGVRRNVRPARSDMSHAGVAAGGYVRRPLRRPLTRACGRRALGCRRARCLRGLGAALRALGSPGRMRRHRWRPGGVLGRSGGSGRRPAARPVRRLGSGRDPRTALRRPRNVRRDGRGLGAAGRPGRELWTAALWGLGAARAGGGRIALRGAGRGRRVVRSTRCGCGRLALRRGARPSEQIPAISLRGKGISVGTVLRRVRMSTDGSLRRL
ncbi:hypothetical protein B005_2737 [Nocardiopsis alba ATCC BAA-2165]|uniref:Uncharacterized protein n=1 Tax=Nocardiopsis alba (strain ATCC BAA-2165 / BE74) TaxID=1205910 RepID=J7LGD8_NOCAA|nr:hypothetical protein B005_2737 [Nocardiopsis alba ATCC BAA-2165]